MGQVLNLQHDEAAASAPDQQQYLTFVLGGETFAVAILRIKEIIEYGRLTSVPMMPAFIRGVINLRGAVVPVVDLQARFGRPASPIGRRTCVVIVEVAGREDSQVVGILVDQVNAVLEIAPADIEPAPSFGAGVRPDFIAGMGKLEDAFVVILHLDAVLSVDELAHISHGVPHASVPAASAQA